VNKKGLNNFSKDLPVIVESIFALFLDYTLAVDICYCCCCCVVPENDVDDDVELCDAVVDSSDDVLVNDSFAEGDKSAVDHAESAVVGSVPVV